MSPTSPHDRVPFACPRGHAMTAGRVIVSWSPCVCAPCAGLGRGRAGHRTYLCLACQDERIVTMCYLPFHVGLPAKAQPHAAAALRRSSDRR